MHTNWARFSKIRAPFCRIRTLFFYFQKRAGETSPLPPVHSTSWKCNLYFVNIFKAGCNFLTKFCSSDSSFNSSILKSLYVKFELLLMRNYAITRLCILYKFHDMVSDWNLHWGYSWRMESVDNIVSVITWLFLEILSDVQYLTRNANLSTSYKVNIWME